MNKRKRILGEMFYLTVICGILIALESLWTIKNYQALIILGVGWFGSLVFHIIFEDCRK